MSYKSLDVSTGSNHSTHSPSQEKETSNTTSNPANKRKVFLPFVSELKETQDKKKNSPTGSPADGFKSVTTANLRNPMSHSASLPSANLVPTKDKPSIPTSKAPPLPTKPSILSTNNSHNNDSTEKSSPTNFGSPFFPGGVKLKKVGSSPGQHVSIVSPTKETSTPAVNHQGPGGDGGEKKVVTPEEHEKLKDRVVHLESEVEKLKKLFEKLLDKSKGQGTDLQH